MAFRIRQATESDRPVLERIIELSVEKLQAPDYTPEQRAGALGLIFAIDSQLVRDGTYLVAEDETGTILGCGAWSQRGNLFGGDKVPGKADNLLDPAVDPARIRSFFVHPDHARKGVGTAILHACEAAARAAGYRRAELVATLTGVPLYAFHGYAEIRRYEIPLPNGAMLPVVPMAKDLCLQ